MARKLGLKADEDAVARDLVVAVYELSLGGRGNCWCQTREAQEVEEELVFFPRYDPDAEPEPERDPEPVSAEDLAMDQYIEEVTSKVDRGDAGRCDRPSFCEGLAKEIRSKKAAHAKIQALLLLLEQKAAPGAEYCFCSNAFGPIEHSSACVAVRKANAQARTWLEQEEEAIRQRTKARPARRSTRKP